jgi:hypothetical protein
VVFAFPERLSSVLRSYLIHSKGAVQKLNGEFLAPCLTLHLDAYLASCEFWLMPKKAKPKKRNKTSKYRAKLKKKQVKARRRNTKQKARRFG